MKSKKPPCAAFCFSALHGGDAYPRCWLQIGHALATHLTEHLAEHRLLPAGFTAGSHLGTGSRAYQPPGMPPIG
jgi:hypothetical protein